MIIAVTARGGDLEAAVDTRFGRAATFVTVDTDTGTVRGLDNRERATQDMARASRRPR